MSTVHTFRFLQISIIIITIIFTITIIIVIIYILIFFLLCSNTWRIAILIILQWTNSTTFEENNTFSDTISKWSLSSLSILEQWRYTRIIKVVLAFFGNLGPVIYTRTKPNSGFTQLVGLRDSLLEGWFNWINVPPLSAFSPFDLKNKCWDKKCGLIEDGSERSFVKERLNFLF